MSETFAALCCKGRQCVGVAHPWVRVRLELTTSSPSLFIRFFSCNCANAEALSPRLQLCGADHCRSEKRSPSGALAHHCSIHDRLWPAHLSLQLLPHIVCQPVCLVQVHAQVHLRVDLVHILTTGTSAP